MLNNSWNIGKFFGIPARIHWSFLLIIAYTAGSALQEGKNWHSILVEIVFVLTVFLCVLLHEYGHAITAKKYDIQTEDIIPPSDWRSGSFERITPKAYTGSSYSFDGACCQCDNCIDIMDCANDI
ncbi:MAG: hypothetical protein IPK61_06095 [Saprospiraceae bacterium]|nr:hypothetical protein [Saprospiraceae bacterium]